jgi:uncharacterized protein (TIGR03435 family)
MIPGYMLLFANHLWQSTLFGIAVWLIALALRKNRAAVRHRLWLVASMKFLIPFSILVGIGSHFQQTAAVTSPRPVSRIVETISQPFSASGLSFGPLGSTARSSSTPAPQVGRFPAVLVAVWICGVVANLFWWFRPWRRVRRAARVATPSNISGPIRVMYGPERFEPGVFGIFGPVLLLPESITHRLSPAELQAVLAHEFCHVQRRDNLAMAIHMVVEALFWFHPVVWLIKHRLIEEQERACDEEVLGLGSEPMVYAESLLKVCEFYVESPLTFVSGVTGSDLKERVGRIMRNEIGETLNRWRKLVLLAAGIVTLATPIVMGIVYASPIRPAAAQNVVRPADTPKWEVVSIKPCAPRTVSSGGGPRGGGPDSGPPFSFSADRMTLKCQWVRDLVQTAYMVYANGVDVASQPGGTFKALALARYPIQAIPIEGGPDWMNSERYTIEAKAEGVVDRGMMQGPMLQALLEERLNLKLHWETREIPVLALTVAKGGSKLKPHQEGSCAEYPAPDFAAPAPPPLPSLPQGQRFCGFGGGLRGPTARSIVIDADGLTVAEFIKTFMIDYDDKPIVDKTGIKGRFDFHLEYALDPPARKRFAEDTGRVESDLASGPLFVDALQEQLGLKLETTKGRWDHVIIDHVEQPSPN